jgi:hypothetical protein
LCEGLAVHTCNIAHVWCLDQEKRTKKMFYVTHFSSPLFIFFLYTIHMHFNTQAIYCK